MADNKRTCTFDGCERPHDSRGYCTSHYKQWQLGRPLKPIRHYAKPGIGLRDRLDMNTDRSGNCWLWTAYQNPKEYGQLEVNGKLTSPHRVAYELAYGPIPDGMMIDHKCHTPACVNPAHLRACTNKQNGENRAGATVNSKSGVRGVYWNRRQSKWRAEVTHNQHAFHVGYFATIEEAERAVIAKRNELFTHNETDRT